MLHHRDLPEHPCKVGLIFFLIALWTFLSLASLIRNIVHIYVKPAFIKSKTAHDGVYFLSCSVLGHILMFNKYLFSKWIFTWLKSLCGQQGPAQTGPCLLKLAFWSPRSKKSLVSWYGSRPLLQPQWLWPSVCISEVWVSTSALPPPKSGAHTVHLCRAHNTASVRAQSTGGAQ
jgi:hypothetical protein